MQNLKRIVLIGLTVFVLHLPAIAQDETPTAEPTIEATVTDAPATEAPTLEPTAEPTPVPPPPDPEPTDNSTIIINGLLIALVVVFVFAGGMFIVLFRTILKVVPTYLQPVVRDVTLRGLDELGRRVRETPDTLDDELFRIIDERMRKVLDEEMPTIINEAVAKAMVATKYPPQA
jgi:hypothetical protein